MARFLLSLLLSMTAAASTAATIYADRTSWEDAMGAALLTREVFSPSIKAADTITLGSGVISTTVGGRRSPTEHNRTSAGFLSISVSNTGIVSPFTHNLIFPNSITGLGLDYFTVDPETSISGDFDGTGQQSFELYTSIGSGYGFFGIVGSGPITQVSFANTSASQDVFLIDNLTFGTASLTPTPVPLPASLPLLLLGLGAIGLMRRGLQ